MNNRNKFHTQFCAHVNYAVVVIHVDREVYRGPVTYAPLARNEVEPFLKTGAVNLAQSQHQGSRVFLIATKYGLDAMGLPVALNMIAAERTAMGIIWNSELELREVPKA